MKLKNSRVIYRLWHNESDAGRIGYIGKDTNYPKRLNLMRRIKEKGCPKLYKAFKKYPIKFWCKEVLASGFRSNASLSKAEIFWIKKFDSKNKGYNCTDGGDGRNGSSPTIETRNKLSKINVGKGAGEKNPFYGKEHSLETKAHWSRIRKGRKHSPEAIAKIISALTGRKVSDSTRKKIGESHKGKKISYETRLKISKANSNPSPETREKLSKAAKGRRHSVEAKEKMRLAAQNWWNKQKAEQAKLNGREEGTNSSSGSRAA